MKIENVKISNLTLLEKNPRRISKEQFKKLCDSLEKDPEFLKARPILVNRIEGKHIVYAGNQRVQAAKKLKWKEVPCIIDNDLDKNLMKSRIVTDNKSFGEFDYDLLYADYDIQMLEDCGFTQEELTGDFDDVTTLIDNEDKKEKKSKTKNCCPSCGYEF